MANQGGQIMGTSTYRRGWLAAALCAVAFGVAATSAVADQVTQASFVRAADGNCAALGKLLAPLGNPTTLPGIANKLTIAVPAFTMALRAQAELAAPSGEAGLVGRWMTTMAGYENEMVKIKAAATAGNSAGVTSANTKLGAIGTNAAALSKQLGLHVCFQ
jgi:hypothetical protein